MVMEAGRELDALVAEKVMGLSKDDWDPPCFWQHSTDDCEKDSVIGWMGWCYNCGTMVAEVGVEPRYYSTDIAAAWEVLEKLHGKFYDIHITNDCEGHTADAWYVTLTGDI